MKSQTFLLLIILLATPLLAKPAFDTAKYVPAYAGKIHPRILFDEGHHNWHTTTGRYKPFVDVLTKDGYVIVANKQKITPEILAGYDIFVCSNASSAPPDSVTGRVPRGPAFTAEERQHLKQWVLDGGSLWLIADHDPAGYAVANVADTFGVNMSKAYTADPKYFDKIALDASWIRYSVQDNNLGHHSVMNGRNETEHVKTVITFTGQSLKGPEKSTPLLLLSSEAYDVIDIEDRLKAKIVSAKGRSQGVALDFGNGRVVVWGEAAMFTEQGGGGGMNFPGTDNKQLLLNIAHWLSRLI